MTSIPELSADQVRALRMQAQRLEPRCPVGSSVAQVLKDICGVQAQDAAAAHLAVRARSTGLVAAGVERARVEERSVVRTWLMRGTLHLVAADDLGWLLALLGPGFAAAGRRRREQLGLDEAASQRGVSVIRDVLAEQGPLTRAALARHLAAHGLPSTGQAPVHLIGLAALQGYVCEGPSLDNKSTYVLLADWLPANQSSLPRSEALVRLARRYLSAYGPATVEDFSAWSGLPLIDARAAWKRLDGELLDVTVVAVPEDSVEPPKVTLQMLREDAARLDTLARDPTPPPSVRLLPAFDTYLLGYRSRALVVPPEHAKQVRPGGGILHPTLLADGRVVATWRMRKSKTKLEVLVSPFAHLTGVLAVGLEAEVADLGRFLDVSPTFKLS
jgi:hypothetical protein